jgi:hypothetical protein
MDKVDCGTKRMLLEVAHSFSEGRVLPFVEFTKLVVAILEAETEPSGLMESAKAEVVHELWRAHAAGKKRL